MANIRAVNITAFVVSNAFSRLVCRNPLNSNSSQTAAKKTAEKVINIKSPKEVMINDFSIDS